MNYNQGLHPDFGKYEIHNDIIVTPFWTKEFCQEMVGYCESYTDRYVTTYDDMDILKLNDIDRSYVIDFADHYKKSIIPMLKKEWMIQRTVQMDVPGIFSPYFVRYQMDRNRELTKHTDEGLITINMRMNDDYEGCELHFPRQKFCAQDVPVGYAMIWPGMLTHPHYVTELKKGKKYTFVSFSWPPSQWFDPSGVSFTNHW